MTKIYDELVGAMTDMLKRRGAETLGDAINIINQETGAHEPYSLWIDDDAGKPGMEAWRSPPEGEDWKVAHSTDEAISIVEEFGIPTFIEFDHDLGLLPSNDPRGIFDTSMLFLKWLEDNYPAAIDNITAYNIHSRNVSGSADIESFMSSWKRSRSLP